MFSIYGTEVVNNEEFEVKREKMLSLWDFYMYIPVMKKEYISPEVEIVDINSECCFADSTHSNEDYDYEVFEW